MKELWLSLDESLDSESKSDLLKSAAQLCDRVVASAHDVEQVRQMGLHFASHSDDSELVLLDRLDEERLGELKKQGKAVAVRVTVKKGEDERIVVEAARLSSDYVILDCPDWKIIPLENLIARISGRSKLLTEVTGAADAKLALEILELGVDGIVLKTRQAEELAETAVLTRNNLSKIELAPVKVVRIKQLGSAARVCVDTCDLMKPGEGILVGSQSSGLFLVQAEVQENPFVETRPFRVNAGPVSLYVLSSPSKTRYLSELTAGDEVLIVDRKGRFRQANLARAKIEWRPMLLIEAQYDGRTIKTVVQNAETVRIVDGNGSKSVVDLKTGDELLAHVTDGGRHFGTLVKETVIER